MPEYKLLQRAKQYTLTKKKLLQF